MAYQRQNGFDISKINMGRLLFRIVVGTVLVLIACGFMGSCYTVPAGQRAVVMTFGKPDMSVRGEGLHGKIPYMQSVQLMSVQTQKYEEQCTAASTDMQVVATKVAINYRLQDTSVPIIYKDFGMRYETNIIQPVVPEVVKACIAKHRAEELITEREVVKSEIDTMLKDRLLERHIIVESVAITDFDFSENFNEAIEKKVTAEQNALAAKNKLEQVKYEADQAVAKAKGEAEAIRIQAEAIMSQGGKDYVQLKAVEKWDGKMPTYTGGAMPFIDIMK